MSKLNIGIAGLGNVGSALVETIEENKNYFFDKTDVELNIVGISARTKKTLENKVKEHNEKHGDKKGKRVTLRMLSAVFRRGVGAYRTNPESVRRNVMGPDQWAIARVNAFLYAVRTGRFRSGKFDRDLLPSGHPLRSNK
mgnify:CR=1 FL=1